MNLTKDVPITSEFLLSNNVNDRIGTIETSQKMLSILNSILLSIKIKKKKKKTPGNQNKGYNSSSQTEVTTTEVTTTTKNNERGTNDRNTTRETELQ